MRPASRSTRSRAANERGADVLLIDTAGRLQNRTELMEELEKIVRVIKKVDPAAPHAVLLVLDATVGQNALSQVEIFKKVVGVTGLVMTKLDGTARGGILVALAAKFALPVHFIGVGESVDDLAPFSARDFARAIAGLEILIEQPTIPRYTARTMTNDEKTATQSASQARARSRAAGAVLLRQFAVTEFSSPRRLSWSRCSRRWRSPMR